MLTAGNLNGAARLYRPQPSAIIEPGRPVAAAITLTLVVLGLAIVLLGSRPSLVQSLTEPAAKALLGIFAR